MDTRPDGRWFFPGIALAISATAFAGFAITYLGPLAAGPIRRCRGRCMRTGSSI